MQTLYTNNIQGAIAATKDYVGAGVTPETLKRHAEVRAILTEMESRRIIELGPLQVPVFIRALGAEVFED